MSTLVFNNVIGIFLDFKILNKIWFSNSVINGKGISWSECRCFNKWLQSSHKASAQKHSVKTNMGVPSFILIYSSSFNQEQFSSGSIYYVMSL